MLVPSDKVVYENYKLLYVLTVKDAQLQDAGSYTVKAFNFVGEVTAEAKLIVNGS